MTPPEKKQFFKDKPLILFSPLDWGLGHTTRSIPVISALKEGGCEVLVACNSMQKNLLKKEFTDLQFIPLEGYNLDYGVNKATTLIKLMLQSPKILIKVKAEMRVLAKICSDFPVDGVISDNRYGFNGLSIPSIFITHQLAPFTGLGRMADRIARHALDRYVKRFSECWVADYRGEPNLAGKLSHPSTTPNQAVRYLGAFSRLQACDKTTAHSGATYLEATGENVLILLSGPEPQRSILEKKLLEQTTGSDLKITIIRGVAGGEERPAQSRQTIIDYANSRQLNEVVCKAGIVVCRPGYTTVMDMLKLKKKMVVIPTPGQAEQEYLGKHLHQQQFAFCVAQKNFRLTDALQNAASFSFRELHADFEQYREAVASFIEKIRASF